MEGERLASIHMEIMDEKNDDENDEDEFEEDDEF